MILSAETLKAMQAMGLTFDQVIELAERIERDQVKPKGTGAERQRRYRERKAQAGGEGQSVTSDVTSDATSDVTSTPPKIYNQTPPSYSEATASGGEAPPADAEPSLKAKVFGTGVRLLKAAGTPDRQARAMLGKWRAGFGDPAVFEALAAAELEAASDPIAFITATLETRHDNRASAHQARQSGAGADPARIAPGEISPRLAAGLAIREKYARMGSGGGGDRDGTD
jgi:hypothetical protein